MIGFRFWDFEWLPFYTARPCSYTFPRSLLLGADLSTHRAAFWRGGIRMTRRFSREPSRDS
jgi:hypothetical protein